eukprot:TRINITY_DN3437_c0_g1_i10.p1 TRINITY_DN3437_c0_g1~~TRINITY_DN3437_c0_g1_i10.p1  ORF type:complete len:338 (+),score=59.84 TRINITY_DN3437_c0_g1_i10:364-1377(+)
MRPASYLLCMQCNADLTKEGKKRRRCAGCHSVFYCDVSCQKKDWVIHKAECKEQQRRLIAIVRPRNPDVDTMAKLLACPEMCGIIACCYHEAELGFEKNDGLAVFWLMRWTKSGNPFATRMLGNIYLVGNRGVPQNVKEGVRLLRLAIQGGDLLAMAALGRIYISGIPVGVPKNHKAGVKLLRTASQGGCAAAQSDLGWCYRDGDVVAQSHAKALKLFLKAAAQGHNAAQCRLGETYAVGNGVVINEKEAVRWFQMSADQGYAPAQVRLGNAIKETDREKSLFWYRKAAEQGDKEGQCQLGVSIFTASPEEGLQWVRKSAEQGYSQASGFLDLLSLV